MPGVDFSDHASYWRFGMPAVMVTDTAFLRNRNYHEASDTPETLDYARMAKVVQRRARRGRCNSDEDAVATELARLLPPAPSLRRLRASLPTDDRIAIAMQSIQPLFKPKAPPQPGDWLAEHKEPGQSYRQFRAHVRGPASRDTRRCASFRSDR